MAIQFQKASRKRVYLKIALMGPAGSGKSYSALKLAEGISAGKGIAAIDTENGSLSLYDNLTDFDVVDVSTPFEPRKYIEAIRTAESSGYGAIVIDSFSHAWKYLLSKKEDLDRRPTANGGKSNQYTNWGPIKAEMDELKDAILQSRIHVICCMRSKTEYAQEGGKVTKIGMAAVQEPDVEYEFTTVFDIGMDHKAMVSKDRTGIFGGDAFKINATDGAKFLKWLDTAPDQTAPEPKKLTDQEIYLKFELTTSEAKSIKEQTTALGRDFGSFVRSVYDQGGRSYGDLVAALGAAA